MDFKNAKELLALCQEKNLPISEVMRQREIILGETTARIVDQRMDRVLEIMKELADDGMTMVVVTHEMGFARKVGTRVLFMDGGQIAEQGTPEEIFEHPQNARTKEFLSKVINVI